ncbi:MAG: CRTAC1 family protein [Sumerlaeia bacterium]
MSLFAATPLFHDATTSLGITHSHQSESIPGDPTANVQWMTGGVAAEDFDGDGWIDLYVLQAAEAGKNLYYRNRGDGAFVEEGRARGVDVAGRSFGVVAGDYDSDGDIDLFVSFWTAPHMLLINDGLGQFRRRTLSGPQGIEHFNVMSPSWGDIDNDGDLDLALGQWTSRETGNFWIYRNLGGGALAPPAPLRDWQTTPQFYVFTPRFADVNSDGFQDLLLACDFENSQLWLNDGTGEFTYAGKAAGVGIDQNGMGADVADHDNDGDLDWFVTSIFVQNSRFGNRLYRNRGNGTFLDVTEPAGAADGSWGWGASFGDLDLDGDLDLFHVNGWSTERFLGDTCRLFVNQGNGRFIEAAAAAGAADPGQGRGMAMADFDNDGDLDIYVANSFIMTRERGIMHPAPPALLRNDSLTSGTWLKVHLEGRAPVHRQGVGSRVRVRTGARTQLRELHASSNFLSSGPGRIAHFGLNGEIEADEVRADWVGGDTSIFYRVAANQDLLIEQPGAALTSRTVHAGTPFEATSGKAGDGLLRMWTAAGESKSDPATFVFSVTGPATLTLETRSPDGATLLSRETLRLTVLPPGDGVKWVVR